MNAFDLATITFLNQFALQSQRIDATINFLSSNHLVKGGMLLVILWWGWFRIDHRQAQVRIHLVSTLVACFIAMVIARALALSLPFRFRPIHDERLDFVLPYSVQPVTLEGWSAFPSDHAVLFYALATGLFYISKRVGIFAIVYTTLFIGFPRVYLGLHYPTDIIAGALIGILVCLLCQQNGFRTRVSQPLLNFSVTKPEFFYPVFFLITYQIADMFNSGRDFLVFLNSVLKAVVG